MTEFLPDKVIIEASYDDSGCYAISIRMNQEVIMREDIVTAIRELFHPGRIPVPVDPHRPGLNHPDKKEQPPAPSNIRPNLPVHHQSRPFVPGVASGRPPGEAVTERLPVIRRGS